MSSTQATDRAVAAFRARWRDCPVWLASAPGRVNLIGEHTDYNDGFVLPIALDRRTAIAAAPTPDRHAHVYSRWADAEVAIDLDARQAPSTPSWANYVRGVVDGFQAEGAALPGFRAVIDSDVPAGGGLSSSAALEVSVAALLSAMSGHQLDAIAMARLCQRAEREFAGVPSGLMDQCTATLAAAGHALLIDCRSLATRAIPMTDERMTIVIINTNVRHDLADGEYARRHAECRAAAAAIGVASLREASLRDLAHASPAPLFGRRARHVITENARTLAAADALAAGDWETVGRLMYASHESLQQDFEVSCRELDLVVEIARRIGPDGGVLGARMTGGGFGGSAICLVRTPAAPAVCQTIADRYATGAGRAATVFSARPGGGVAVGRIG